MQKRFWYFTVTDLCDRTIYLDKEGEEIDETTAKSPLFIGTQQEAMDEAAYRADAWEDETDLICKKHECHAMGKA